MRLKDKVAIITGGSGGFGEEAARQFSSEGAAVIVADVAEEAGQRVVEDITSNGGTAEFFKTDVTSPENWGELIKFTCETFQKLDVLINNAGISNLGMMDVNNVDNWKQLMDVNANSVFYGTRAAVPAMVEQGGGSIINVSSVYGILGSRGHPGYHASKGAVRAFTKATAVEYGPQGIRANSIHPGVMQPMKAGGAQDEKILKMRNKFAEMTPLGRMGTPADVANAMLFLASDESSYITGTEIVIDGGLMVQ
jgi:NAD(P)-dependent dehydrogenase (short-subunit alcohol dehydrogenase family)